MQITPYADINDLLDSLVCQIQLILNQKLVGVYLYGSLVWGDFDYESSDIDVLVATSSAIDGKDFSDLQHMQNDLINTYTYWDGRIEIAYVTTAALQTFKSRISEIAIISPGEPFHIKEAGKDWLINWYMVQEKGLTLFGPAPATRIDPISKEEFIHAVRQQAQDWADWIYHIHQRPGQAYAILTMCRAFYAYKNAEQVSKRQAAEWVAQQLPEWSALIENAFLWRAAWRDEGVDHDATFPETLKFVQFMIAQIVQDS
jgi:predicted nucleotidyltransferase